MPAKKVFSRSCRCVKNVQIRSYFWSVFSPNKGKCGPEITSYLDTFQAVCPSSHIYLRLFLILISEFNLKFLEIEKVDFMSFFMSF